MTQLITPAELPNWVPGQIIAASDTLDWRGVALRGYRYRGQDVYIPPMRDYMIVAYERGLTPMERCFDGRWQHARCAPGTISLLTRAQRSNWNWSENVDVNHVYLEEATVLRVASEAMDQHLTEVRLRDVLDVEDPVLTAGVAAIAAEARAPGLGGNLYVEAVATQLSLHLLRHYAEVTIRERVDGSQFSPSQRQRLTDYIDAHLHDTLSLPTLAALLGLGVCSFTRRFRSSFGCAPHVFVTGQRVLRARRLLADPARVPKQVAADCGFADQAHLNRVFKAKTGMTPGEFRARHSGR